MQPLHPAFRDTGVQDDSASTDAQRIETARWSPLGVIIGTPGDDSLVGTSGSDTLDGGAGNDTMEGGGWTDELLSGAGNDAMYGGDREDDLFDVEGDGNDTLDGGADRDLLTADWSSATTDITWQHRATKTQVVNGQTISSIESLDLLLGSGNDVYRALSDVNSVTVEGGLGNDSLDCGGADYGDLSGGAGNDTLSGIESGGDGFGFFYAHGGDGADVLIAGARGWDMWGDAGNDTITGGQENDDMQGGSGNDVITAVANVEWFTGDQLFGDSGNDTLIGSTDDEWFHGGSGNDSMVGGVGDDHFYLEASGEADTVVGGDGKNDLDVSWSDATQDIVWVNNPGTAQLVNGATISGIHAITGELGTGNDMLANSDGAYLWVDSGAGNDTLVGTANNDDLKGNTGNDSLRGANGNDTLDGSSNDDRLQGGSGNDSLFAGEGSDWVQGGAGDDSVYGQAWPDFGTETGADTFDGGAGIDRLVVDWSELTGDVRVKLGDGKLAAYQDKFGGFERFDLHFGAGNDTVTGGADDSIDGGAGNDLLRYGGVIAGNEGNDTLVGDDGADRLYDSSGNNSMVGGAGNDTLEAGSGTSTMSGGAGGDRFLVGGGPHAVLDFESGVDKVYVDGLSIGDHNNSIKGAVSVGGPGGFAATAELVVVTSNIDGDITAESAAAAIGSATSNYSSFSSGLFVVDNGVDSAVFLFDSAQSDAVVSAAELHLIATLVDTGSTGISDYRFF